MSVYSSFNESELEILLVNGDKTAYTEIFTRYQPLVFLHALKKIQNQQEAEDIVQEIFIDLWHRRSEFKPGHNLAGYLFTCVRNKFVKLLQHKNVRSRYLDSLGIFVTQNSESSDAPLRTKQLSTLIEQEINALPEKMREAFLMSRREYKTYKEIAMVSNISEETVRKQIKNALKILRKRLGFFPYLMMLLWYF